MNGVEKIKNMSRRRFFKRAAREMLFSDWICRIFAYVAVGAIFVGINHFGTSVCVILNELTQNIYISALVMYMFLFLALAMLLPLLYGLVYFETEAADGEKGTLSNLFYAFSSKKLLLRSYSLFFNVIFRCVLWYLPAVFVYCFRTLVYEKGMLFDISVGGVDVAYFLINTLLVIVLYCGFVLSAGTIIGVYITVKREEMHIEDCFFLAKKALRKNRFELSEVVISFLPLFVVSLFSIGFLFVMYTIPYTVITLVMYSKYLCEKYEAENKPCNL